MQVKNFLITTFSHGPESTPVVTILKGWMKNSSNIFIVENDNGEISGVVTIGDILAKLLPFYLQMDTVLPDFVTDKLITKENVDNTISQNAGEIMTKEVVTVGPNDYFLKAAALMFQHEFDYLPVIDEKNKCIGLVTRNTMEAAVLEIVKKYTE